MWYLVRRYIGNKYLGLFVNGDRSIEEVIKERIALYNKAYYKGKRLSAPLYRHRGSVQAVRPRGE